MLEVSIVLELKYNEEGYWFSSLMQFFFSPMFVTPFHAPSKHCHCAGKTIKQKSDHVGQLYPVWLVSGFLLS